MGCFITTAFLSCGFFVVYKNSYYTLFHLKSYYRFSIGVEKMKGERQNHEPFSNSFHESRRMFFENILKIFSHFHFFIDTSFYTKIAELNGVAAFRR
jgi:hypothetical protein